MPPRFIPPKCQTILPTHSRINILHVFCISRHFPNVSNLDPLKPSKWMFVVVTYWRRVRRPLLRPTRAEQRVTCSWCWSITATSTTPQRYTPLSLHIFSSFMKMIARRETLTRGCQLLFICHCILVSLVPEAWCFSFILLEVD